MSKNDSKVSIIIPCYNGEKYIHQCIGSILEQTYDNIEIVFINDGSIDNSVEKILKLKEAIENRGFELNYIEQKNQGVGAAIEKGIFVATGEYLTLLDVDDIILPKSVEARVLELKNNSEISIARTNGYIIGEDLKLEAAKLFFESKEEKLEENIFLDLIKGKTFNWAGSYMVRAKELKEFYKAEEFYKTRGGQNLQILMPLAYNRKSVFINEPLMMYIKHSKSITSGNTVEETVELQKEFCQIREILIEQIVKNPDEKEECIKMARVSMAHSLLYIAEIHKYWKIYKENFNYLYKLNEAAEYEILMYNKKFRPWNYIFIKIQKILKNSCTKAK